MVPIPKIVSYQNELYIGFYNDEEDTYLLFIYDEERNEQGDLAYYDVKAILVNVISDWLR